MNLVYVYNSDEQLCTVYKKFDYTKYIWYYHYMPKSGEEVLKLYLKAGWTILNRRGSHVKIGKGNERETIPMHDELHKGLEQALLKRLRKEEK